MKRRGLIHNLQSVTERRRELRHNSTLAERLLWASLRNCHLDGRKFRRQHSIGPYIADFYCPECRVIVELDGAGHMDPLGVERDEKRTNFLARFGIEVIRFENKEVLQNREWVLESIRAVLRRKA
jgi:very-short-patch-repair endonuclease